MRRATWLTDIHLIFLWDKEQQAFDPEYDQFVHQVLETAPDAIFLSGDIAEAPELIPFLERLERDFRGCPLYFVLGNHDSYRSSIRTVRKAVQQFCQQRPRLHYLTVDAEPITLTKSVGLIGHDGWCDGRFGELEWSRAKFADYTYIEELRDAGEDGRRKILNALGDEAAEHVRTLLSQAVRQFKEVFLLTHYPPWLQVALYKGRPSDYEIAPHAACRAVGEAIVSVMQEAPNCQLTVLCGHMHWPATYRPLPNVLAITGKAECGEPAVQKVFELGD
jgi:3',5'-cyclic AMP phosphodiesterase CpdA